jgi:hypothetical protein
VRELPYYAKEPSLERTNSWRTKAGSRRLVILRIYLNSPVGACEPASPSPKMGFLQVPPDRSCPFAAAIFVNLLEMFSF